MICLLLITVTPGDTRCKSSGFRSWMVSYFLIKEKNCIAWARVRKTIVTLFLTNDWLFLFSKVTGSKVVGSFLGFLPIVCSYQGQHKAQPAICYQLCLCAISRFWTQSRIILSSVGKNHKKYCLGGACEIHRRWAHLPKVKITNLCFIWSIPSTTKSTGGKGDWKSIKEQAVTCSAFLKTQDLRTSTFHMRSPGLHVSHTTTQVSH